MTSPHDADAHATPDDPDRATPERGGPLAAIAPQGPLQVAVAIVVVAFLIGAIGYFVGTRRPAVPSSAVDIGFLEDMSAHHDQAITMALCALDAEDDVTRKFAQEVLIFQNRELGMMDAWLTERGRMRPEDDTTREAMGWMGMVSTAENMPGMATQEQLDALCAAKGKDVDRLFLQLLREHHVGGTHMADHAAEHAVDPEIKALAQRISRNQKVEANEYTATLERLGLE